MAEKKQFKAESKRLLDLMINSIYTHKEIFLRELISNASDATDKLYYKALTENISDINKSDLTIDLAFDKEGRTLTVTDHGIGMNKEELEEHLGTIANSGSFKFKNENESDDIDIIGQFGVGFYSAFMVAKKVEVSSRAYGSDQGYTWVSEASDGYEIFETDNLPIGTTIKLYLKDNTEEENYDEAHNICHSLTNKYTSIGTIVNTENYLLNAVLNVEIEKAKSYGISVKLSITNDLKMFKNSSDIISLIGNILDNAISYLSKNKVKNNEINFSTGYEGSYSVIKCRNNILDSVLFNNPSLKTDKKDKDNHGKGITIINSIAHKYNGDVIIKERNKEFIITVILDNRSLPENL